MLEKNNDVKTDAEPKVEVKSETQEITEVEGNLIDTLVDNGVAVTDVAPEKETLTKKRNIFYNR